MPSHILPLTRQILYLVIRIRVGFVEPTFALEATKTCLFSAHTFAEFAGAVPVADRYIAFIPEWMIRQVVFGQVSVDVALVPINDRIHLHDLVLLLGDGALLARRGLVPA